MRSRVNHWLSTWSGLLGLFTLASFVEAIFYGQVSAFTPLYLPHLGISSGAVAAWTGSIAAVSSLVGVPFLPFWGALADRFARKPIIIRSFGAHFVAAIVAMLAGNVWVFLIGRSIMSLSLGNSGLMMATLSEQVPEERHGLAFSIMNSAPPVGAFLGPLLGGPVVDRWGFPTLLAVNAGMMGLVILLLGLAFQDTYRSQIRQPLVRMAVDSVRVIAFSPRLRTLFPALILLFAGWMLAFTYIPLAVTALYPQDNQGFMVGLILGSGGLAALILSPLVGTLSDRFGLWRVLVLGTVLEILLWPIPAFIQGIAGFGLVWAVLNGVASGVFALSFIVLARSTTDATRGRVMAFSYLPVNIGSALGPAIGSLATQKDVFTVFPLAAVITAVGLLALVVAGRQPLSSPGWPEGGTG